MSTLLAVLGILGATVAVVALAIKMVRVGRTEAGRAVGAMLDPFNQIADPTKRQALAHVQQMEVGHDQEADGQGDKAPDLDPEDALEREIRRQMESSYLKKRGARGKQPDNGARV